MRRQIFALICIAFFCGQLIAETPVELRLGRAGHAFDHLGGIGAQADAAAASGATIIYSGGLGGAGYAGLPPQNEFEALRKNITSYGRHAKECGIELNIGYLCATSIVKLDSFDKNWTDEFRAQFKTRPAEWRQQDRHGKPLASWYGADYNPACMSNPDWRAYQRAMVRQTLETGHDGIFFDNPTVHPQGCFCPHCMTKFAEFMESTPLAPREANFSQSDKTTLATEEIRKLADAKHELFLRFRSTIARDFLADMRTYARSINPRALITCNNSLNAPSVFYSQCRTHGYNIDEMSKAEDFVVIEDMNNQPRTEANGHTIEYGPTYKMLHAISHGKPIVAVTIAGGDYHTPPNLMRLAMAEAAANDASYLSWPTWPETQRRRMVEGVRPEAEFLRKHTDLLDGTVSRTDFVVFLPFRRWLETDQCAVGAIASVLTAANRQYKVVSEDNFTLEPIAGQLPALILESRSVLNLAERKKVSKFEKSGGRVIATDNENWRAAVLKPWRFDSVSVNHEKMRAALHYQQRRAIIHLYNLNVQRLSSFEDKVTPALDLDVATDIPFPNASRVTIDSPDEAATRGVVKFNTTQQSNQQATVSFHIPRVDIHSIVVIEP